MHKLVKCKNVNQHIAHSRALVFVQLHECTVIRLKTRKTPLTFAIGDGINKSQGFTNAPFKGVCIVQNRGVKMPSFFGFMAWSYGILVPIFLVLTWLFLM